MRVLVASLLCISSARAGNLIVNGNFTNGSLTGWKILSGAVQVIPPAGDFTPPVGSYTQVNGNVTNGSYTVDLTNSSAGVLYQEVATKVGTTYLLSFYFGGNPDWFWESDDCTAECIPNDGAMKSMQLYIDSVLQQTYTCNSSVLAWYSSPQWVLVTYVFTATSTTTVLSFHSLNGLGSVADPNGMPAQESFFGPLLSGVSLVAL